MLSESAGVLLAVAAFFFVSFLVLGAAGEESANMSSGTTHCSGHNGNGESTHQHVI